MAPVLILMGSQSDWPIMQNAAQMLKDLGIAWRAEVVSAHRTPDLLKSTMAQAERDGVPVVIAGAGGAAHLPLGVPVPSQHLKGLDSLLSIVQMPKGVAVGTMAIGAAGAANAGLLAAQIIGSFDASVRERVVAFRTQQRDAVMNGPELELPES